MRPAIVEQQLGHGGRAVQRALARVLQQRFGDRDPLASYDAQRPGSDPVLEVARRAGGEPGTPAALDAIGHPECDVTALADFDRLVLGLFAAPGDEDVPGRLMPLSGMNRVLAAHFSGRLAPGYDVRGDLAGITAPTLVIAAPARTLHGERAG